MIRYGDEIGMGEDLTLKERDAVRTPMQWSNERNAGFSTARRLVHPVISKGPYGYQSVNVDAQRRDPGSLLNWMIKMIRVRKECPEIGWGEWVSAADRLARRARAVLLVAGNRVVVVHNFSREPQEIAVAHRRRGRRPAGQPAGCRRQPRCQERQASDCAAGVWISSGTASGA